MNAYHPDPHSRGRFLFALSAATASLLLLASLAGIVFTSRVYPTGDLVIGLLPNDIASLAVGLPFLLAAMILSRRGSLWARLCWPGALLYIVYNSLIAVLCLPPGLLLGFHLALLALSLVSLWFMFRIRGPDATAAGAAVRFERLTGILLLGMGALFLARAVALLAGAGGQPLPAGVEFAVTLADLLLSPVWIISGVLLLRRLAPGRPATAASLAQLATLFTGLLLVMLIRPPLTGIPFSLSDFLVIAIMGLVIIVPGAIFLGSLGKE